MSGGVIQVDFIGLEKAIRDLETADKRAVPYAMREGVNRSAFAAKNVWAGEMDASMTLRNRWTKGSLRVQKATASGVDAESEVGSLESYVAVQEKGGWHTRKGRHGVGIPTGVASGEGIGAHPRKRLVRKANALAAISLARRVPGSVARKNAAAIRIAKQKGGGKFAFLQFGKKAGIFRVSGGKRKTRLELVWDTSHARTRIPKNPMLQRSLDRLNPTLPSMYMGVLREQLRRHRLFGY